jgi:hypothetical protein
MSKPGAVETDGPKAGAVDEQAAAEDPAVRKSRFRSIYIVHFAMLIFSLGFSIILTGVYPYLQQGPVP